MKMAQIYHGISIGLVAAMVMAFAPYAAAAGGQEAPDPAQLARGAKAWAENCNRCHNTRGPNELQDHEWDVVAVTHMRVRANLPGQMARDIAAFLKASND